MWNAKPFCKLSTAMVMIILAVAVFGCGKKEGITNLEEKTIETEESIDEASLNIEDEFNDLTEEILANVPNIEDITQEELRDMSVDEFRAFIKVYCPNYRSVYKITNIEEMTKENWESLRRLVNYNLFGSLWFKGDDSVSSNSVSGNNTENLEELKKEKDVFLTALKWDEEGYGIEEIEEIILIVNNSTNEELKDILIEIFNENEYNLDKLTNMNEEEMEFFKSQILEYLLNIREEIELGD